MGLKISQLPDKAADDGMMIPASVGGMTYKLLVGIAGGLAKFLHKHEIADVTGLAAQLAEKAPAGYGLGENPVYVADANLAQKNGWYAIEASTLNLPDPTSIFDYSLLRVDVGDRPDVFILQTVCTQYQSWRGCKAQRMRTVGVWQPWEWVNPPMLAGVEYRTTERYKGKPVYTKLVFVGTGPTAGAAVTVNHGIANMGYLVDFCGVLADNGSQSLGLPYYINANNQGYLLVGPQEVVIRSVGTSLSGYVDTHVWLKYTKTTD